MEGPDESRLDFSLFPRWAVYTVRVRSLVLKTGRMSRRECGGITSLLSSTSCGCVSWPVC